MFVTILQAIAVMILALVVLPVLVYMVAKMGVLGFLSGRKSFYSLDKGKEIGDDEGKT